MSAGLCQLALAASRYQDLSGCSAVRCFCQNTLRVRLAIIRINGHYHVPILGAMIEYVVFDEFVPQTVSTDSLAASDPSN
jgi:5-hydroxyisourate hydrolase-like protein (transthyretin family)